MIHKWGVSSFYYTCETWYRLSQLPKSQPFLIFKKKKKLIYIYIYIEREREREREILKFDNHDYADRVTIDLSINIETP